MTGAGTIVDGALRVKEDDGSVLTFTRDGQALNVAVTAPPNAPNWVNDYCGTNGSVDGIYFPVAARSRAEDKEQDEKVDRDAARLSRMASKSGFACLKGDHGGVDCTAGGFQIEFGDCGSDLSYGGITAAGGVTLLDQLPGHEAKLVARLADKQLVCIEATAKKGRQGFYYVRAVPVASVAGCKGNALCKSYGDRPVQWLRSRSGEPCRRDGATKAYVGDCAAGWVDRDSLEEFSMGL